MREQFMCGLARYLAHSSMRLDNLNSLRRAVQQAPEGERIVALAVDIAVAFLLRDETQKKDLLLNFNRPDADRITASFGRYFSKGPLPVGATEQSVMDSQYFLTWQLEWLPNFVRTAGPLEPQPRDETLAWLKAGSFPGENSRN